MAGLGGAMDFGAANGLGFKTAFALAATFAFAASFASEAALRLTASLMAGRFSLRRLFAADGGAFLAARREAALAFFACG